MHKRRNRILRIPGVMVKAKPEDLVQREIVYLPRSEVKALIVIQTVPLYTFDKYTDLLKLEQEMKSKAT